MQKSRYYDNVYITGPDWNNAFRSEVEIANNTGRFFIIGNGKHDISRKLLQEQLSGKIGPKTKIFFKCPWKKSRSKWLAYPEYAQRSMHIYT